MAGWQDLDDCRIARLQILNSLRIGSVDFLGFPLGMVCAPDVMNQKAEELKARTKQFALDVLAFVKTLPKTPEGEVVRRQLVKAATGVMANYRSSCRARSHTEFTALIGVVLEEADEAEGWLETIRDARMSTCEDLSRLYLESVQLRAIFFASTMTGCRREQESAKRSKRARGVKKVTTRGCVVAMDNSVAKEVRRIWPSGEDLITWAISDPWGGDDDAYKKCANEIAMKICELKSKLLHS